MRVQGSTTIYGFTKFLRWGTALNILSYTHFIWSRSNWPLKRPWFEIISFQSASNSETASSTFCGGSFFCIRISFATFISSRLAKVITWVCLQQLLVTNLMILRWMSITVWLKHHQLLIHNWHLFSPTLVPSYQVSKVVVEILAKTYVNMCTQMQYF